MIHVFLHKSGFGPFLYRFLFVTELTFMAITWTTYENYIRRTKLKTTTTTLLENEGTAKAESSPRLSAYGVVVFLECITGRILVDGRTNIINIVQNNIYCCWKLLSAMVFFHKLYYCAVQTDSLLKGH